MGMTYFNEYLTSQNYMYVLLIMTTVVMVIQKKAAGPATYYVIY